MIDIQNLSFTYDNGWEKIFDNVSFTIDTDWRLGFTGRNGRGKTTLCKILDGTLPYSGKVHCSCKFEYFPYPIHNPHAETLTVLQGLCPQAEEWQLLRELNLLDVSGEALYRNFDTLSQGERTKIMLAAMFLKQNYFLLIDEPTNHLDLTGRQKVAQYLLLKKGFIVVSHDREFLNICCDHMLVLNRAEIQVVKGNFESWKQNKELQDRYETQQNEKLVKNIRELKESARQTSQWADKTESSKIGSTVAGCKPDRGHIGHKAAKLMKRAKCIERRCLDAAEEKSKLLKNIEKDEDLKLSHLSHKGEFLIQCKDVTLSYGNFTVFEKANFCIKSGDRIALIGKNGCGKSSLLTLLQKSDIPFQGQILQSLGCKISFVSQSVHLLKGGLCDYAKASAIDETLFKTLLIKLGFHKDSFNKDMQNFSEGQKKKIMLARSLCEKAHLYIWDEPLNYMDIVSRMQIERLILKDMPTMIFTEHDAAFVKNIANFVIDMNQSPIEKQIMYKK